MCFNLCYCAKLKQYAIIDVCIVAFGFVLRLLAGGVATHIILSKWIVLMTFLITLFMSFAKRRDDVLRMEKTGEAPRKNTSRYNLTFINQAITITASAIVPFMPYLLSFAAGAMLYVVVEELIPQMSAGKHSNLGTIMFAIGFSLMMVLDVALG